MERIVIKEDSAIELVVVSDNKFILLKAVITRPILSYDKDKSGNVTVVFDAVNLTPRLK